MFSANISGFLIFQDSFDLIQLLTRILFLLHLDYFRNHRATTDHICLIHSQCQTFTTTAVSFTCCWSNFWMQNALVKPTPDPFALWLATYWTSLSLRTSTLRLSIYFRLLTLLVTKWLDVLSWNTSLLLFLSLSRTILAFYFWCSGWQLKLITVISDNVASQPNHSCVRILADRARTMLGHMVRTLPWQLLFSTNIAILRTKLKGWWTTLCLVGYSKWNGLALQLRLKEQLTLCNRLEFLDPWILASFVCVLCRITSIKLRCFTLLVLLRREWIVVQLPWYRVGDA